MMFYRPVLLALGLLLTACGVSKEDHQQVLSAYKTLEAQKVQLEQELERLRQTDQREVAAAKPSAALPELEKAIAKTLAYSWKIKSVKTVNGALTIHTNIRSITDTMYYPMLEVACYEIDQHGGAPPSLNEIQILNSFGTHGWVFESPAQCPQIVHMPSKKARLAVAAHTSVK